MSKFIETEFVSTKEILKFPDHYVAMAVMVDQTGVVADESGRKIVKKGTIVGGNSKSAVDNLDEPVVNKYVATVYASLAVNSTVENGALTLNALAGGTGGNDISITIVDPGTNSAELGVVVSSKDITVNLATSAEGVEVSTAKQVADAINADSAAKLLVKAEYAGTGAGVVAALAKDQLENGAASSGTGAEGVLMNDVDVTYGDKEGAMIIHGFIAVGKMPYGADNADAASTVASALPMIKFIK